MSEANRTEDLECICPGCHTVEHVRILNYGWLFRCDACKWEYGHPQSLGRADAIGQLADAKRNAR